MPSDHGQWSLATSYVQCPTGGSTWLPSNDGALISCALWWVCAAASVSVDSGTEG